jgi:opacity protein-like surface antigen
MRVMLRRILTAGWIGLWIGAGVAQADDPSDFATESVYIQIEGVYARENLFLGVLDLPEEQVDNGFGFAFSIGQRANEYVAIQSTYEYTSGFTVGNDSPTHLLTFDGKVFPLHPLLDGIAGGRVQPWVGGGMGAIWWPDSGIKTALAFTGRWGGGLDLHVSDNIALTSHALYQQPIGNLKGLNFISVGIGVAYHFR